MFTELIGAKVVAPFFGTSLYVWSSALGITLGSLAIGYYSGGVISKKMKNLNLLLYLFMIAGFLILLIPFSGKWIMLNTIDMSVQTGVTISMLVFLAPPLVICGMMSPMIINYLTDQAKMSGRISGLVYSVSTLGGILFTYLTGFYLLPVFGIIKPTIIFGTLIIFMGLILLLLNKKYLSLTMLLILILFNPFSKLKKPEITQNAYYVILYDSEGLLGQVKVIEYMYQTFERGAKRARGLLVNNTGQTIMDVANPQYSLWDYSFFFPNAASIYPEKSDALILGLGGGTLYKQFERLKFNIDVVELDERIRDVAFKYFAVDKKANIVIDDARHYLMTSDKKYDVITFDLFLSETPPSHLLTVECFERVNELLNEKGMLMINFYGFLTGDIGIASRSVYATLKESFKYVDICATPAKDEHSRNLIFIASQSDLDFTNTNYSEPDLTVVTNLEKYFVNTSEIDFSDAMVLTDDCPVLENLYLDAAIEWRKSSNKIYCENFIKQNIQLFK